jgi:hypothetical protein
MTTPVYDYNPNTAGVTVVDTSFIQTDVQNEYAALFGGAMDVTSPSTPQGLLINAETLARVGVADNNATLANQINPNFAGGVYLDAILSLMGAQRLSEEFSIVYITYGGIASTIVPSGFQIEDTNGNIWIATQSATIPMSTTLDGNQFQCTVAGAIVVDASIRWTQVVRLSGLETVTNDAVNTSTGTLEQSDASARQYRLNTLYLQGNASAGAIIAAVYNTLGVASLSFVENDSTAGTVEGVTMVANSIYLCINGGTDVNIASALTASKAAGIAYNNGASSAPVSYSYTVPVSGQVINVIFDRPDIIDIGVKATVILNQPVQNYLTTIQNAILDYAAGNVNGLAGLIVGQSVSPFEISSAIGIQYPQVYVTKLEVQNITASGSLQTTQIDLDVWEMAQIQPANIVVVIG